MSQKPTLAYWKIRGFAAGMQYLFKHLNVDYDFKAYETKFENGVKDNSEWLDEKFNLGMDFPNLPYIIDGDYKVSESSACYEYICAKWKPEYLGRDVVERGKVAMMTGILYGDFRNAVVFSCYSGNVDRTPIVEKIDAKMPDIYKFLANNTFIVGNAVTWLDFAFYELIELMVFIKPDLYEVYPNLRQYS